ncbi:Transferase hexapeptide (Six repeat-containing protein) [Vibrio chagasii]|nr:Transferase hexapeptide (Six repeat-containing protein) [Vibrio chagasii]
MQVLQWLIKLLFSFIASFRVGEVCERPKVNGLTILSKNTHLGKNVNFNGFRVYGNGKVKIGDNFHSGKGCHIITQVHNYYGEKLPYDESYIYKNVIIGDNVWFGMNVSVLSNSTIGEGAIIQAGSVVVSDIPALAIAGGNPARVFSYRDKEHYNRLKRSKSFN